MKSKYKSYNLRCFVKQYVSVLHLVEYITIRCSVPSPSAYLSATVSAYQPVYLRHDLALSLVFTNGTCVFFVVQSFSQCATWLRLVRFNPYPPIWRLHTDSIFWVHLPSSTRCVDVFICASKSNFRLVLSAPLVQQNRLWFSPATLWSFHLYL